ncbi:MAG TPA: ABC transporter ATP-binding protein [Rubrivivax sp.]|nr:ABC transporter ATP-binding protein [Rubrivivax sp.]
MSNTPAVAIDAQVLSLRYGKRTALDQVSFSVPVGAVAGLVGRNGAGKSTLLRCLVGLTLADGGTCQLLGCDSTRLDDATRSRIGYVSQSGDLLQWLKVWQHIEYIGSFYPRWQAERAHALCRRLVLDESAKVSALSVGDQQKLALVLAMAHDPDLLLMDEPVASLDPLARRDFMRLLFEGDSERETPRTVLLSSHLLTDLERVVSHVMMLRAGRVQLQGEWHALQEATGRSLEDLFVERCGDAAAGAWA